MSLSQNELYLAGLAAGTDKISEHHYERYYSEALSYLRDHPDEAIFEIGLDQGASLRLWRTVLPLTQIYGLELANGATGQKIEIFQGDQSIEGDLLSAAGKCDIPVAVIIDDGSHLPEHQLMSFNVLFPRLLKEGGYYFIEDVEVSFWTDGEIYGYPVKNGLNKTNNIVNIFRQIVPLLYKKYMSAKDKAAFEDSCAALGISPETISQIGEISFGQNIIKIRKQWNSENPCFTQTYRFAERAHQLSASGSSSPSNASNSPSE